MQYADIPKDYKIKPVKNSWYTSFQGPYNKFFVNILDKSFSFRRNITSSRIGQLYTSLFNELHEFQKTKKLRTSALQFMHNKC